MNLDPVLAGNIMDALAAGNPPDFGVEYYTVGLSPYLEAIEREYLDGRIKEGGSGFKLVYGSYGLGKTHFLYCVRSLAWRKGYVTSYIVLSPSFTPFHDLGLVYKEIVANIAEPVVGEDLRPPRRGIDNLLRSWARRKLREFEESSDDPLLEAYLFARKFEGCESVSFATAVREAFLAVVKNDWNAFIYAVQWLKGEGLSSWHKRKQIIEKITSQTAFRMLRSLTYCIKVMGYKGIVILLDEAEPNPSLSTRQRHILLSNLREMVDACSRNVLSNTLVFYAVPDKGFLEGRSQVYEALRQRLSTVMDVTNPYGIEINLEKLSSDTEAELMEIGLKLAKIYEVARSVQLPEDRVRAEMKELSQRISRERFGGEGYRRRFVQEAVRILGRIGEEVARGQE